MAKAPEAVFLPYSSSSVEEVAVFVTPIISSILQLIDKYLPSSSFSSLSLVSSGPKPPPRDLLLNLKKAVLDVQPFIHDVENMIELDQSIHPWLKDFILVASNLEDALDEFQYDLLRFKAKKVIRDHLSQNTRPNKHWWSRLYPEKKVSRSNQLRELVARFKKVSKRCYEFNLKNMGDPAPKSQVLQLETSDIRGEGELVTYEIREGEREKVISLLLSRPHISSLVAIVGTGGIGKTTLARQVYHDPKVFESFPLRIWLRASGEFNVFSLTQAAIEQITGVPDTGSNLNVNQKDLNALLREQKVLLVLDDIAIANATLWNSFLGPFTDSISAKILVTTRTAVPGNISLPSHSLNLNFLSEDESWLLFQQQCEFDSRAGDAYFKKLIETKCHGLPLAVMVIGSLLKNESNVMRWDDILHNDLWNFSKQKSIEDLDPSGTEIVPALRLCYAYMPSCLKPCFSYCSNFPKGYMFRKEQLTRMWIAQGFVQPREGICVEDISNIYFDNMQRRSFFQRASSEKNMDGIYYEIHDLIHDLMNNSCLPGENRQKPVTSDEPWEPLYFPQRTCFSIHDCKWNDSLHSTLPRDFFVHSICLRVLEISCSSLAYLPETIGDLKHLRYLCLKARIQILPESVCNLYNLQTLDLFHCTYLLKLPTDIGNLISLKHLELPMMAGDSDPPVLDAYQKPGIVELCSLQTLVGFCVGRGKFRIEQLYGLEHLRQLCISGLRNVTNMEDAKRANLENKRNLQTLRLDWCNPADNNHDYLVFAPLPGAALERVTECMLDSLKPNTNLSELVINGYDGSRFPRWVGDSTYANLTNVHLDGCNENNCKFLPPLGLLPSLRSLFISRMQGICFVGREFCCRPETITTNVFPSLEELKFDEMFEWRLWNGVPNGGFPRLRKLTINYCPKLRQLPTMSKLTSLQSLEIHNCESLESIPLHNDDSALQVLNATYSQRNRVHHKEVVQQFGYASSSQPTSQNVDGSVVYGREHDRKSVTELLLSDDCRERNVSVIKIVAAAGIGKTTLVHLVYKSRKVRETFEIMGWVGVPENYDVKWLIKSILESLTGMSCCLSELCELEEVLKEELAEKKFLLVLDNFCNEDQSIWNSLMVCFTAGAKGSIVILTTQNKLASNITGLMHSYELDRLSEYNCWFLFKKIAFFGKDPNLYPELIETGRKIVSKCSGVPLVAKALGGLLHYTAVERWRNILSESSLWDIGDWSSEAHTVLIFCYDCLPLCLKQCFVYCYLFPKSYIFEKDHLVRLWLSQGFILPEDGKGVEAIGSQYFDELLYRSFFQYSPFYDAKEGKFVMHDLFHDLAGSVSLSGNKCLRREDLRVCVIPENIDHVSFVPWGCDIMIPCEPFTEPRDLRTFLFMNRSILQPDASVFHVENTTILNDLFMNFRSLRALDLSLTNIKELPGSVGILTNLCYLALNNTDIKRLPESICSLHSLETLELQRCNRLLELPKDTKNLANLRHLIMWKEVGFALMPLEIGQLTSLQTLSTFYVGGDEQYSTIRELKELVDLRGDLHIGGLENVTSGKDAEYANLKNKEHLRSLTLQWYDNGLELEDDEIVETAGDVLQSLQPHDNLQELIIRGYFGTHFPTWMGDASFSKLLSITLDNCYQCSVLSPLGLLPSLRYLSIRNMNCVQFSRYEFHGSASVIMTVFPSLEILKLWEMYEFEEWGEVNAGDFPRLCSLSISRCLKLRRLPCFTFLSELLVHSCPQLPDVPNLPSLETLKIEGIQNLKSLSLPSHLSSLRILEINNCNQLSSLNLGLLLSIEQLKITKCPKLQFSPNEHLPSTLQVVYIHRSCTLLGEWCPYEFEEKTGVQASRKLVRSIQFESEAQWSLEEQYNRVELSRSPSFGRWKRKYNLSVVCKSDRLGVKKGSN